MTNKENIIRTEYRKTLVMSYSKPASEWMEGLPIGNGRIAGMVCGTSLESERIALNHEWLYKGIFKDREADEIPRENLEKTRKLLFAGKYKEATDYCTTELSDYRNPTIKDKQVLLMDPFQPAGDLTVTELDSLGNTLSGSEEYLRRLDMNSAVVSVSRLCSGINIKREFFASQSGSGNMCMRFSAGKPICWRLDLTRRDDPDCELSFYTDESKKHIVMHGEFAGDSRFTVALYIASTDGKPEYSKDSASVTVKNAKTVTAYLNIGATDKKGDPDSEAFDFFDGDFETALKEHMKPYSEMFCKCRVNIEDSDCAEAEKLFTDELLAGYKAGRFESIIPILYFNYGRYLLISSSGELPANLQGKWNEELLPPWNSDFHCDINLQMNYWMAETVGLSKFTDSFFNFCEGMIDEGKKTAMRHFGCRGILYPLATDCHGRSIITRSGWDIFVGTAAWLATHYWMHWQFTRDTEFLVNRAYPFFKLIAEFYEDFLCEDPDGNLQIVPSQSPENHFEEAGDEHPVSACISSAIDIELCTAVFDWVIFISNLCGADRKQCEKWIEIRKRLPRIRIGKNGELLEWTEQLTEAEPGHRHFSHLVGVYPIDIINKKDTPDIFNACRVSLDRRLEGGGGHTGWSRAWTSGLYARFGEGELAMEHLRALICDFATVSMLDLHPPRIFQIDGNFGGSAAIAEMLIQSYEDVISPLPACPEKWQSGNIEGFHCRGGFTVDFDWIDGRVVRATVTSSRGGECRIRLKGTSSCKGSSGSCRIDTPVENGIVRFDTTSGCKYFLEFS